MRNKRSRRVESTVHVPLKKRCHRLPSPSLLPSSVPSIACRDQVWPDFRGPRTLINRLPGGHLRRQRLGVGKVSGWPW